MLALYAVLRGRRSHAHTPPVAGTSPRAFNFAAVITAHKDLTLVPPLIDSLLKQHYSRFRIYVVADACTEVNLPVNDPRIVVLQPEQPLNAKIRSIDYAINHFKEDHDVLIIFDADNLVHPDYLQVLNTYFNKGYRAVQTNMLAKNTDSLFARLDAAGNLFNNFTDRKMRMELGLSANIWGLGIAIETDLYKEIVYQHFLGGFDKKIQADIVKKIPLLAYAQEAIVYDEKVENGEALEKQRTRWINAYFKYFATGWDVLVTGIRRGRFNLVYFGINLLRPPLFLILGAAMGWMLLNLWLNPLLALYWLAAICLFAWSYFIIVAVMSKDKRIYGSLYYLPLFLLRQVKAILKIKAAGKTFLKTENNRVIYIEEVLNR
nr:glycosyltransferase [Chitinophaga nivalis]